jgi:hypothetical protein
MSKSEGNPPLTPEEKRDRKLAQQRDRRKAKRASLPEPPKHGGAGRGQGRKVSANPISPRYVYGVFDPALKPVWAINAIHRCALVAVVESSHRKRVQVQYPGMLVMPRGRSSAKEKRWIDGFCGILPALK